VSRWRKQKEKEEEEERTRYSSLAAYICQSYFVCLFPSDKVNIKHASKGTTFDYFS